MRLERELAYVVNINLAAYVGVSKFCGENIQESILSHYLVRHHLANTVWIIDLVIFSLFYQSLYVVNRKTQASVL